MKPLPEDILQHLENITKLDTCFKITLKESPQKLLLTSSDILVEINNESYFPYSGLKMVKATFNDSSNNKVIISGIYENQGISVDYDLTEVNIEIILIVNHNPVPLVNWQCSWQIKNDLDFIIKLEPETVKFNQSLLKSFSKTCRTIFGDDKCKVNKADYATSFTIKSIDERSIILNDCNFLNGYFNDGDAYIAELNFRSKINYHLNNMIELFDSPPPNSTDFKITLTTVCDKNFQTCCKKFNNAVNFRGEPFIPEKNFLENNFK